MEDSFATWKVSSNENWIISESDLTVRATMNATYLFGITSSYWTNTNDQFSLQVTSMDSRHPRTEYFVSYVGERLSKITTQRF